MNAKMKLVKFNYDEKTVLIARTVGNVIYLETITWEEMHIRTMKMLEAK